LSDHTSEVFVVMTANDISKLRPEFSRAERFDGIFMLDLPSSAGFRLKPAKLHEHTLRNLGEVETAHVLGFEIGLGSNQLAFYVPERAWDTLDERLCSRLAQGRLNVSNEGDSIPAPVLAIGSWLGQLGPAYLTEHRDKFFARLFTVGNRFGIPLRSYHQWLKERWRKGYKRWLQVPRGASSANRYAVGA